MLGWGQGVRAWLCGLVHLQAGTGWLQGLGWPGAVPACRHGSRVLGVASAHSSVLPSCSRPSCVAILGSPGRKAPLM